MTISVNPWVSSLHAYVPGEQPKEPGFVKLNTNECPYPPAPEVMRAVGEASQFNKYPDPTSSGLRKLIATRLGVRDSQVLVGNGSDEVLRLICHAFLQQGTIGMLDPTYVLYETLASMFGARSQVFPVVPPDYQIPDTVIKADTQVFFLPNPNPPIGTHYPIEVLRKLAEANASRLLIIDEAYVDFAGADSLAMLEYPNVLITRTFSKSYSLAGLRVGFAVGPDNLIQEMDKIRDSYNVNRISQAAAAAAWEAHDYHLNMVKRIREDRDFLATGLIQRGFTVPQSAGNFVFARRDGAEELYLKLKEQKVLVRYFRTPALKDGIRITIGTRDELITFLKALDQCN